MKIYYAILCRIIYGYQYTKYLPFGLHEHKNCTSWVSEVKIPFTLSIDELVFKHLYAYFVSFIVFNWSKWFTMFHGIAALSLKVCNAIHLVVWFMD